MSEEIPCGLMVSSGVDENRNGKLEKSETIVEIVICDKDRGKLQKPIIRTMPKGSSL